MRKILALAGVALAATVFAGSAVQAGPNYALSADGASIVSVSSAIGVGDFAVMQSDLLTATPTPWYFDGDTRYIFGANDANGTIVINLGQVRQISEIGTSIDLPSQGDRPVIGPVTFEVSTDGIHWVNWGSPLTVLIASTDPFSISGAPEAVQYIEFNFGNTGSYYGNFGGSAVNGIFADGTSVPEPLTLSLFGAGLAGAVAMRRRKKIAA